MTSRCRTPGCPNEPWDGDHCSVCVYLQAFGPNPLAPPWGDGEEAAVAELRRDLDAFGEEAA